MLPFPISWALLKASCQLKRHMREQHLEGIEMNPGQKKRGGRCGGCNPAAASQTNPGSNLTVIISRQSYLKIPLMYGHESSYAIVGLHPPKNSLWISRPRGGLKKAASLWLVAWRPLPPVPEQARLSCHRLPNPTQISDNKAYEMSTRCSEHALINALGEEPMFRYF